MPFNNFSKSFVIFTYSNYYVSYYINNYYNADFLGVVIDENLSWASHIDYIKGKIAKNIGIIRRMQFCLPKLTLSTLYNTIVLPYLNYCNIIWANNKSSRLKPILLLQKKIIRIITNSS